MSQITISHLSFTYDGDYTPVFQDLDLRLDTGWKLGLVGRNGRGKTTLLKLLAGEAEGRGTISRPVPCLRWPRPVSDPMRPVRALLLVLAFWITLPLLLVGLMLGCRYRLSGPDFDKDRTEPRKK